ncbi:Magnesium transporter NIPA2 [Verticillium dahliae VDG1]|nr:Magnesium transporter NIPA2 [Verticillium dahliae VDG1]
MATAGGASSIITQVQQGGPPVNAIGDVGADETITMDLRGTRFVLSRDELLTLPEFVLLSLFPNGLFPEGQMGGFADGDAVQVDYDPVSLQYMLDFFRNVAQSIPMESSPNASQDGDAVPLEPLGSRDDASRRAGIIVLREDLDFYVIPPRPDVGQLEMIEIKRAAAKALLSQGGIFSGLKRSDEPGTTEAHLIEMLTAGGFNHDDSWGHRAGEPNKAVSCSNSLTTSRSRPVVADGWSFGIVASELSKPRSILFDSNGALLVVGSGVGIKRLLLEDEGGTCMYAKTGSVIVESPELNHGIALSNDGRTLYASTPDKVFAWVYDATNGKVSEKNKTVIKDMYNAGHTSRTLLVSDKAPGLLVVSRGSEGNVDAMALRRASGRSQLRVFNVTSIATDGKASSFSRDGKISGWGLRNSVGVVEHPDDGGMWSVENSVDNLERDGVGIHPSNPGEELYFHGFLNGSTYSQEANYGYPICLALWSTDGFPRLGNMSTGDQFEASNDRADDTSGCSTQYTAPRLTFQAHSAPLDIVFTPDGSEAFVTFHGSWNREKAVGYALPSIVFDQGFPKKLANSTNAVYNVMYNADLNDCPSQCFRPFGLAWDRMGRLFMTSDSTGEIFVLERTMGSTSEGVPGHTAHPSLATTPAVDWSFLLVGVFLVTLRNT